MTLAATVSRANLAKAKAEKWYRNDLTYMLHSGQRVLDAHFKSCAGQLFVANISRQFGKSFWAVKTAIELAQAKPRARIKYATALETDLVEFIQPAFEKVIEDCPESIKPKYKVQGAKWVFPNGSEIKLVGLDKKPNGLRGNSIDLIVIDEAGFVGNLDYIYSSVIIPATLHRPNCRILFISTPPSTPAHPFGEFIKRAELEGSYLKLDIYQNPRITEQDIERMAKECGGRHTTTFRREFLCELVLDEDLALVPEWRDDFIEAPPEKDEYRVYYHRYDAMDMGRKDFTALLFGYYDFKRATLWIEDELKMNGPSWTSKTLDIAVRAKELELWGPDIKPFRRVADNNNPHLIVDLASIYNLSFFETDKESLDAMVNEVRVMVGEGKIRIHPRCKLLIGCLKYGIWDKHRKEFARDKVYGHYDHFAALVYLVRNLAKHSNPIPASHGFVNHKSWMLPIKGKEKSHNARTLEQAFTPKKRKVAV